MNTHEDDKNWPLRHIYLHAAFGKTPGIKLTPKRNKCKINCTQLLYLVIGFKSLSHINCNNVKCRYHIF